MRRIAIAFAIAAVALLGQVRPAFACGALVSPNGSVRLGQATTFVAWHDGVEHYVTSFSYEGDASGFGYIVPLPAVPTSIVEGGAWTLQRLEREVAPPVAFAEAAAAPGDATVVEQVQVAALDITVLRGSGDEVERWAAENQFVLGGDALDHLRRYAQASPVFMAARYDTARAHAQHLTGGDGTPVLLTMPTPHLWVPIEVLAEDGQFTSADLFLLTDARPTTGTETLFTSAVGSDLPGAPGFTLAGQEPMNERLFHDLSSDRNMGWVPDSGWLSYLRLRADGESVTYDLAVGSDSRIRLAPLGTAPEAAAADDPVAPFRPADPAAPLILLALPLLLALATGTLLVRRRRDGQETRPAAVPSGDER